MEENEIKLLNQAGKMGGEYLESINQYDLRLLTPEQWQTFLECVCKEFMYRLAISQSQREDSGDQCPLE
jgi:hypothetical protein